MTCFVKTYDTCTQWHRMVCLTNHQCTTNRITTTLLPNVDWSALMSLVPEACQSPWVLKCPLNATSWLAQAATLLEITIQLVDIGHGYDILGALSLSLDHLTLKIARLCYNLLLCGSQHPYINTCGAHKSYLKCHKIQLAMLRGAGSLIAIYLARDANFKPVALSFLEILHFE